jgi:hypothetical protein
MGRVCLPVRGPARLLACKIQMIGCLQGRQGLSRCVQNSGHSLAPRKRNSFAFPAGLARWVREDLSLMTMLTCD